MLASPTELLAQSELPDHVVALARIKARMQQSLEHIPDYTCVQTVERARLTQAVVRRLEKHLQRRRGQPRTEAYFPSESSDSIQVDLAYVDGNEMYSWPGAETFEERSLAEMVGFGNLSVGIFAATAHNLFDTHAALFEFAGRDDLDGRALLRFDFRVGLMQSGFILSDPAGREAEVPYTGSIWAEPDTFALVRIETQAREIPPHLEIDSAVSRIDYQSLDLNGESFLIPGMAHEVTRLTSGAENHSRTAFTDCRRFSASSDISFGPEEPLKVEDPVGWEEIALPPRISLAVRLTSGIDSQKARIGDRVVGVLESEARHGGAVVAPEGAEILGRIRRLERYSSPAPYFTLGIELSEVRFDGKRGRFTGHMTRVLPVPGVAFGGPTGGVASSVEVLTAGRPPGRLFRDAVETYDDLTLPGVGVVSIQGGRFEIGPGWRMSWETVEPEFRER